MNKVKKITSKGIKKMIKESIIDNSLLPEHKIDSIIKEKFKQTNLTRKKAEGSGHTDGQIDDLINNAPRILNEIKKKINKQTSDLNTQTP